MRTGRVPHVRCPAFCVLFCCLSAAAQSQQLPSVQAPLPNAPAIGVASPNQQEFLGTIGATVVDPNGNFLVSARITLVREGHAGEQVVSPDNAGHFVFTGVTPGPFALTITAEGFATQQQSGILHEGEALELPQISLPIASATTEVRVTVTNYEIAEEEIKVEETQRLLGVIPNFYVSYRQDALPLRPKQKFELAWKSAVDPVSFAASGVIAGVEQAEDGFSGYGQGTQGFAKRYGATYADNFIGNMLGGAVLPSLFKQDPRYFYKGTGSTESRILYALANAVVCKGDNGHWQVDYSGILGSVAAGGISNLYYPASSRNGLGLTFENTLIGIGGSGVTNILQEFILRRFTSHSKNP